MIRKAELKDLDVVLKIYEIAKKYMRKLGNKSQWINGYPTRELLENDIKNQNLYVFEDEDGIFAVFAFIIGNDPTYTEIEGKWLTNNELYGTIHRIASDGSHRGILEKTVEFGFKKVDVLRIDTHQDNKKMQECIHRCGFEYCGIIHLEDGSPRLAYERINYLNRH